MNVKFVFNEIKTLNIMSGSQFTNRIELGLVPNTFSSPYLNSEHVLW